MPGSGEIQSAQGTTVTFGGVALGHLTGFDSSHKIGQLSDVTNVDSELIGTGDATRLVRQYDCTSVEPASLSCAFYGAAAFTDEDLGISALLVFDSPEESYSAYAILTEYTHAGSVGQFATGTASFQLNSLPIEGSGS